MPNAVLYKGETGNALEEVAMQDVNSQMKMKTNKRDLKLEIKEKELEYELEIKQMKTVSNLYSNIS